MTAEALDQFIEQRDLLPQRCPAWCLADHPAALEEGCNLEEASTHVAADFGITAHRILTHRETEVRPYAGGIHIGMHAEHARGEFHWDATLIYVDTHDAQFKGSAPVPLTTGEARVLARQLLHLADLADLDC